MNSKLKTVKMMVNVQANTVKECDREGGVMEYQNGIGTCSMDSKDSSGDGSEVFNSFYSEGFTIDKVKYAL